MDTIRVGGGQINLGEAVGWGAANTRMYGNAYIDGSVGIGTTGPNYKLEVAGTIYAQGGANVGVQGDSTSTSVASPGIGGFNASGGYAAAFYGKGYITTSAWEYNSDRRLKENIQYYSDKNINALDIIGQLKPVSFDYIDHSTGINEDGFIAQDVQSVLPNIVSTHEDGILSLKTTNLIPYLVKGIQEQQLQIDKLSLTETGDIILTGDSPDTYAVTTPKGIVDRISAFAELVVAKIQSGLIETKKLIVDGVDILKKLNELSAKVESQQKQIEELKNLIKNK